MSGLELGGDLRKEDPKNDGVLLSHVWHCVSCCLNTVTMKDGGLIPSNLLAYWNCVPFSMPYGFSGKMPQGIRYLFATYRRLF